MVERFDYLDENEIAYLLNSPDDLADPSEVAPQLLQEQQKHPGFLGFPTHVSLFEICTKAATLNGSEQSGFLSHEQSAETLAQLQVCLFAERRLMEIFIAIGRQDPVSQLFNSYQLKHLERAGFYPDAYANSGPDTAETLVEKTAELFRLWCATNAKASSAGLTYEYLAAYTQDFMNTYEQIAYGFKPETPHENPFLTMQEAYPWLINPLMMDPTRSKFIPSNTVKVYIDDICVLVPMGPIFYSFKKRVCYLNTFKAYDPYRTPNDKRYQMEVLLKTVAAVQMFQAMQVPLDMETPINTKNFPNPKQMKKLALPKTLSGNIPHLWQTNNEAVRLRHLYPMHNFNPAKGHNFLASNGLGPADIDKFDILDLVDLLKTCITETKKEHQIIRERPDVSIRIRQKPKVEQKAKTNKNNQTSKKIRKNKMKIFQATLPGLN